MENVENSATGVDTGMAEFSVKFADVEVGMV